MEDRDKILAQFESAYKEIQSEFKLDISLEELDKAFFIKDSLLHEGYLSVQPIYQMSGKIASAISSSVNFFHDLLMPNTGSLISSTESKLFQDEVDRKRIWKLMSEIMALEREHHLAFIKRDLAGEVKFIKNCFNFHNSRLSPELIWIFNRIENAWKGSKTVTS